MSRLVASRSARHRPALLLRLTGILAGILSLTLAIPAQPASAVVPPGDEPGVTMRVFQLGHPINEICEIKAGQTPNVDVLQPTIDWDSTAEFGGVADQFLVHALANLTIETAGTYNFRLISDDGSELLIDDQLVVDHDGLHGATEKDGATTLTEGVHALRVNYFEATGGERLTLLWQRPGDLDFTVVPNTALSTEAGVTRVTAPGTKQCEGQSDTAGDGLQLQSVNPSVDLVNLRPAGFEPMVTGLEWMGDDLLVLTWGGNGGDQGNVELGSLYRLSGVKAAQSPADVTYTRIAEGLKEPMGVKVVDGGVYVSEKTGLIRLLDAEADGVYESRQTIATYPFDGNFHEFGFGLLYEAGSFYVNLSVSIDYGGATTIPQGSYDRGTHLRIDAATGEIEYVAGGLRTPHGIGRGPENGLFVTDNQGAWLPASKLLQIKPGEFYNHYTTEPDGTGGRFDHLPVTKPVLWMPQNEIANSPSEPVMIHEGPYAGQMLIGDVTYGGLQRAYLEKVGDAYQGALFRHSQGLEAGVTRVLRDPADGTLYVGGLGAGGNWGQAGKLQFGLQKLKLNGAVPFDMHSMKVVEGGFEIDYTKPLSAETLTDLAGKYQFSQWTYRATAQYGGPKIDEEALSVTSATPSADGKTVTVKVAGLKPDRVVYVRSPRPFASADGEQLWSTEAWYTLNTYPGYVPVPDSDGIHEFEEGTMSGTATIATDHPGYTGSGFVAGFGDVGAAVDVEIVSAAAGERDLTIRYANGIHPYPELRSKTVSLVVNGVHEQITLPTTGAWTSWGTHVVRVPLKEGSNTVRIEHQAADDGHVNLDHVALTPRLEAEDAALAGSAVVQTEHAGFSGSGYVGGLNTAGASVTFEVDAPAAGDLSTTVGYANGPHPAPGTKTMSLYVDGVFEKKVELPSTGEWRDYGDVDVVIPVKAGANKVSFRVDSGDGHINLDYLDLGTVSSTCGPVDPDDQFEGASLDACRWSTVLNPAAGGYSVSDGKLHVKAAAGDISGGTVSAKNILLQGAQADDTWSARTHVSLDGTDDYLQAGLVAHTDNDDYAKAVLMERPDGSYVVELGRRINGEMVYVNSPQLPAAAPAGIDLQLQSTGEAIQARYSLDGGTTWTSMGSGYPVTGLVSPKVGLAAYNGTGTQTAHFEHFTVGEPTVEPETCAPVAPDAGYRMLFDGTAESLSGWTHAGPGFFTREADCTLMTHGGLGLLWHEEALEGDYSLQVDWKLVKDDNAGVFVGFPEPGNDPWVAVDHGYEIQIDASDDPDSTTGAVYNFQAADLPARDGALKPVGQWNHYELLVEGKRIRIYLNDVLINDFTSTDPARMDWPSYIGLQNHGGGENVYFKDIQVKELADPENVPATVTVVPTSAEVETGAVTQVEVTVSAEGVASPTGSVTLSVDGQVLPAQDLQSGKATFAVGPFTQPGTVALAATYSGDLAVDAGEGTGSLTVVAAGPAGVVTVDGKKVDANAARTTAEVTLLCEVAADCAGSLLLQHGGLTLGEGSFSIPAGSHRVSLTLTDSGRTMLAMRGSVKADLVVSVDGGETRTVRLQLTR